jgi:hypothetical protein
MAQKITVEEALQALPAEGRIHTQMESRSGMLFGADWDRDAVEEAIRECGWALPTHGMAKAMGKGIVICYDDGPMFIETREGWEAPNAS